MEQYSSFKDLIWLITKKVSALEKQEMACCGLTISQSHAILEIGRKGEISLIELAEALSLDKSTMSRTVNTLVDQEYIERTPDNENRRYIILTLTDMGHKIYGVINETLDSFCDEILSSIPDEKKEQVKESIILLYKSLCNNTSCC